MNWWLHSFVSVDWLIWSGNKTLLLVHPRLWICLSDTMKGWHALAAHWHFQCLTWHNTGIISPCQHPHSHSWEPFTQQSQFHPHSLSWLQNSSDHALVHHMQAQSQNSTDTHPHPSAPRSWDTASSGSDAHWEHWETQSHEQPPISNAWRGKCQKCANNMVGLREDRKCLILGKGLALLHSKM